MNKVRRFFKSKIGFALTLSLVFCLVQIPLILHHALTLDEAKFYHQYLAPLGLSYAVARFAPLIFTTLSVFLLSWFLPIRRISKICIAFSSIFFYFNSVRLVGFRLIPLGRELVFTNPLEFFAAINEAFYHTFLPVTQLCLIPIVIYLLDCLFHFKFLRKLEIIKFAKLHHISGVIVFLIPIALSIPNAIISAIEDDAWSNSRTAAVASATEEFNRLPPGSAIAFTHQAMRAFVLIHSPLLTDGRYFYDLTTSAPFNSNDDLLGDEYLREVKIPPTLLDSTEHVYYLTVTNACGPIESPDPQFDWKYLGTVRQLGGGTKAFDLYRVR